MSSEFNDMHRLEWSSQRQVPVMIRACYELTFLRLEWGTFTPLPIISPLPPWFNLRNIVEVKFPVDVKNNCPRIIRASFEDMCQNDYTNFIQIYTDGSHTDSPISNTAAVYIPHMELSFVWKLNEIGSIVTAEIFGILKAAQFAAEFFHDVNIGIFTDS